MPRLRAAANADSYDHCSAARVRVWKSRSPLATAAMIRPAIAKRRRVASASYEWRSFDCGLQGSRPSFNFDCNFLHQLILRIKSLVRSRLSYTKLNAGAALPFYLRR
jgi:hypothetical protein